MAKPLKAKIKLQVAAGKANPAPPIGPALGQHGVNIMEFCNQFNEKTKTLGNTIIPVIINVYEDRTFDFILKTPPAAVLIKKALNIEKGSDNSLKNKVGTLTQEQLRQIAETKLPDLNTKDIDAAMRIVRGTAINMGIKVE